MPINAPLVVAVRDKLINAAKQKRTLTYKEVGDAVGVHCRAVGKLLAPIQDFCINNKLPPLTVLVRKTDTGLPGEGFIACAVGNVPRETSTVFAFNWDSVTW